MSEHLLYQSPNRSNSLTELSDTWDDSPNTSSPNAFSKINNAGQSLPLTPFLGSSNVTHPLPTEESLELLCWRAETLMEEMMLGAVDMYAGGPTSYDDSANGNGLSSNEASQNGQLNGSPPHSPSPSRPPNRAFPDDALKEQPVQESSWPSNNFPTLSSVSVTPEHIQPSFLDDSSSGDEYQNRLPNLPSNRSSNLPPDRSESNRILSNDLLKPPSALNETNNEQFDQVRPSEFHDDLTHHQPLQSYERVDNHPQYQQANHQQTDQHQQFDQSASQPSTHQPPPPAYPASSYSATYATTWKNERPDWSIASGSSNDYLNSVPRSTDTPHTVEQFRRQFGERYQEAYAARFGHGPDGYSHPDQIPTLGPIVNQNIPFADSMSVEQQARRHSNLLPRQSTLDLQALKQEMAMLQERINTALPLGRDTAERARHLLEKGQSIFELDADRSAEVSYYMQQVCSILQRAEQRIQWSNLYRNRLQYYLFAWFLFALLIIVSTILYTNQMEAFVALRYNLPTGHLVLAHFIPFLTTLAAGALGGAVGALVNMWRYSKTEYGFFDRKYGMLGIILPIISIIVGILLYIFFALLGLFFGFDLALNFVAGFIPAVFTFLFGCVQERIYGTSS